MPLISLDDEDQRWVPTHVNITVLRARGLRTKGKHGSRYVYTIIQLGKEKYTTGLVEKAVEPEWNEECTFELMPGLLELSGTSAYPPGSSNLVLTVMHRVLIGLDVFLGQTIVPLDKLFQDGMCPRNEWFKLHSKSSRPEKERGDLQLTVQFTRNSLTASMYDLSVKEKRRSALGKLKDRVTGRKRDVESSSAIVPGRYAALSGPGGSGMEGESGSEGERQGQTERDLGAPSAGGDRERRGSKVKDFFGKLRKSSDTRSCSSLASDSSAGSSVGEPFCPPVELSSTPIYSSRVVTDSFRGDVEAAGKAFAPKDPKVMTHKRAFSDEASQIITMAATASGSAIPRASYAVESLKEQSTALSKSSLCINGSHVYTEHTSTKPSPGALPARRALLEKCSPLSRSLQNLTRRGDDPQKAALTGVEGRRWSFDKTKKEEADTEQAVGAATSVQSATSSEDGSFQGITTETSEKGKKLRRTLFSSGRSDSLPTKTDHSQAAASSHEGRIKGWFGSSDAQNKPSQQVSPKVEISPARDSPLALHAHSNTQLQPQNALPPCPMPTPPSPSPSLSSTSSHANPFTPSPPTSISISPSNPFRNHLQTNPFFEEILAEDGLKSPPAVGSKGASLPQYVAYLAHPGVSLPSPAHATSTPKARSGIRRERPHSFARQRSLPVLLSESLGNLSGGLPNSSTNRSLSETSTEWDDSFEAFATSRLKSPSSTLLGPSPVERHNVSTLMLNDRGFHCSSDIIGTKSGDEPFNPMIADVPPLPPRRPLGSSFSREKSSDSWLARAEELAVQREASFLTQSDRASRQHMRERKHKRNTVKSWPHNEGFPTDSIIADLHSEPAAYHHPTTTIIEEPGGLNFSSVQLQRDNYWEAGPSERDSPGAQERRHMEQKNNALNSSHLDICKDMSFSTALGFTTEEILHQSLFLEQDFVTSPLVIHSITTNKENLHIVPKRNTHTDSASSDNDNCHQWMAVSIEGPSDTSKLTNGTKPNLISPPGSNKNIDSSDFAFVDSDISPSEITINALEIYDQNANKMLSAYQMIHQVHSSGNPVSLTRPSSTNSVKTMELETSSTVPPPHITCETKPSSEHCVLNAESWVGQPRESSPHYQSSCVEKGGWKGQGNTSFTKKNNPDSGDEKPTSVNHLDVKALDLEQAISMEMSEMASKSNNSLVSCSPSSGFAYSSGGLTEQISDKSGGLTGEVLPHAPSHTHTSCILNGPSGQATFISEQSSQGNTAPSTESIGMDDTCERSDNAMTERTYKDSKSRHNRGRHTLESDTSDIKVLQEISTFAELHARLGSDSSKSIQTCSSQCNATSSERSPSVASDIAVSHEPNPNSNLLSDLYPLSVQAEDTHNQFPLTSTSIPTPINTTSTRTSAKTSITTLLNTATTSVSSCTSCTLQPKVDALHTVTPGETEPAQGLQAHQESSPHPVKPLTPPASSGDKRTEARSVLDKLKSSIHSGRALPPSPAEVAEREARLSEARAQYQTLSNMELISLLLQQEVEVERQREEAEHQGALLERREAELRKMKVQVRDLEDYIDKLLVRIMEQTPTLLQKTTVKPNS